LVSDRSGRRGLQVRREFACTLVGAFPPVLVVRRAESRLGLEGRTRTLSGPSPDLTSSVSVHGSYLVGSYDLVMGGSGGEPGERLCGIVAVTSAVTELAVVAGL